MTRGYIMMAMGKDYVKQAYLCAMSIIATQAIKKVSLVTSDEVPDEYKSVFDKIIEVPWHDKTSRSFYKTEHRWKVFHLTPYEETVVLDTDMLFLSDISYWWKYFEQKSIGFISNVRDYRNHLINDDYYRKTFTANNLPNIYCAFHYFKKDDTALDYYKTLNYICENYEKYYEVYAPKQKPILSSMDVNHAIALIDKNVEDYTVKSPSFVHMKSKIQGWSNPPEKWLDRVPYYLDEDFNLKIGNFMQHGIVHYTEQDFCDNIIEKYGKHYGTY